MKYYLVILMMLFNLIALGQKVIVSTKMTKVMYCGVANKIDVMVEGAPSRKIILKVDTGKVEKISSYEYQITPLKEGNIKLSIVDSKGKKLSEEMIKVKLLPLPTATLGGQDGGKIAVNAFKAQIGLRTSDDWQCFNPHERIGELSSYTVSILRSGIVKAVFKNDKAVFTETLRTAFEGLKADDKIIFSEIMFKCNCGSIKKLDNIEFILF
jgi:GldM C-terminal domain